jgi:hypothetical protein
MTIRKPIGLSLLVGLMAMAFVALPAVAGAAPTLTTPSGSTVPVGTTLTATSTNATTVLDDGTTLTCEHVTIHGIVEKSSDTEVLVGMEKTSVDTAEGCLADGFLPVEIEATLTSIKLTATVKTASFDFAAPALGLAEESDATVSYTGPKATTIHVKGTVTGSEAGTFTGDFTIKGPKGEVISVD